MPFGVGRTVASVSLRSQYLHRMSSDVDQNSLPSRRTDTGQFARTVSDVPKLFEARGHISRRYTKKGKRALKHKGEKLFRVIPRLMTSRR